MTEFYKRYRNLFFVNQDASKKSASNQTPLKQQFKKRLQSLKVKNDLSSQINNKSLTSNRFQNEILPQLNRLNKKNQKYRVNTQIQTNAGSISLPPPIYYSPQVNNKYKKSQDNSSMKNVLTPRTKMKRSQIFRQRFYHLPSNDNNHNQKSPIKIINPQQQEIKAKSLIQLQPIQFPKESQTINQKYYQTQPVQQVSVINEPHIQRRDKNKKVPGYPQINNGLVFSQYEKQNQFKMVDSRIRDIKWIQKYYPRGYINQYREALIRRRQNKQKLIDRRNRLKRLYADEEKSYTRKKSII